MTDRRTQLPDLMEMLQKEIETRLGNARRHAHTTTAGDRSEESWIEMLTHYLPMRYQVNKAFVIDSNNECSDQIDIVIHDRQYSPFVLKDGKALYVPAESVYAVFEVKQSLSRPHLDYAANKILSVRRLHRTSLPIPHAGGVYPPKPPQHILGGLLCLESDWSPSFGESFYSAMQENSEQRQLNLGCVASTGVFEGNYSVPNVSQIRVVQNNAPLAYFVLRLISRLQLNATVPCLDVMAYANWITESQSQIT